MGSWNTDITHLDSFFICFPSCRPLYPTSWSLLHSQGIFQFCWSSHKAGADGLRPAFPSVVRSGSLFSLRGRPKTPLWKAELFSAPSGADGWYCFILTIILPVLSFHDKLLKCARYHHSLLPPLEGFTTLFNHPEILLPY